MLASLPGLTFLDERPIHKNEMRYSVAWFEGGMAAESEERVCMYICMHVCMYVCMHGLKEHGSCERGEGMYVGVCGVLCIYTRTLCVCILYACIYTHIQLHGLKKLRARRRYVCMYLCIYVCMYTYTHIHTYIHIHIHTYRCV